MPSHSLLKATLVCAILFTASLARAADEKELTVVEATFGVEGKTVDVTPRIAALVKDGRLIFPVSLPDVPDPALGKRKTLRVKYKIGDRPGVAEALEGGIIAVVAPVKVESAAPLAIVEAKYGAYDQWVDVTAAVAKAVEGPALRITVNNALAGGDPKRDVPKSAYVIYTLAGVLYATTQDEDEDLVIDPTGKLKPKGAPTTRITKNLATMMLTAPAAARPRPKEHWSDEEIGRISNFIENQGFRFDALPKVKKVEISKLSPADNRKHKMTDGWQAIIYFDPSETERLNVKIFEQVEPVILRGPESYIRGAEKIKSGSQVRTTGVVTRIFMTQHYIDGKTPAVDMRIFLKDSTIISTLLRKPAETGK